MDKFLTENIQATKTNTTRTLKGKNKAKKLETVRNLAQTKKYLQRQILLHLTYSVFKTQIMSVLQKLLENID